MKEMKYKLGQIVEIKDLLYWGDAWDNFNGYGTIIKLYPKVKKANIFFINSYRFIKTVNLKDIIIPKVEN